MRILHYTMGLPPKRSGGLTKYAIDLMQEESRKNRVYHLYPGNIDLFNRKTRINKVDNNIFSEIFHYQLINSLPLPLFDGVKEPDDFMYAVPIDIYVDFFKKIQPEIIHVHTLMGIHREFFLAAKELGIKIIYTTHDYFGICPKINLYKDQNGVNCTNYEDGNGCVNCCFNSMETSKLLVAQTPIYPLLKKMKSLKNSRNKEDSEQIESSQIQRKEELARKYVLLREFYFDLLSKVDLFHFNSTLAEQVFKEYLPDIKGKVIEITHSNIEQPKHTVKLGAKKIRIGYLGPVKKHKGFFFLLNVFKQLPIDKFELHLYGDESSMEGIYSHGGFNVNDLERIFSTIDVLVVPSLWKETFGFIVLEALTYGTDRKSVV